MATLAAKITQVDHTAVSGVAAAAAAVVLPSATEVEEGSAPPWRPDDEYASPGALLFDNISFRNLLSAPGNDDQRLPAHLQCTVHTNRGTTTLCRRNIGVSDASPPRFWQLFLRSIGSPR